MDPRVPQGSTFDTASGFSSGAGVDIEPVSRFGFGQLGPAGGPLHTILWILPSVAPSLVSG